LPAGAARPRARASRSRSWAAKSSAASSTRASTSTTARGAFRCTTSPRCTTRVCSRCRWK
jgi:hypothetical protein